MFVWVERKRMYSCEDIQRMLDYLSFHKGRKEFREFLAYVNKHATGDASAIKYCIDDGCYESFDRFDSDVGEQFVKYFEHFFILDKMRNTYKPTSQFVVVGEIQCTKSHLYYVVDTVDGVVESYPAEDLKRFIKMGIKIDGVSADESIQVVY